MSADLLLVIASRPLPPEIFARRRERVDQLHGRGEDLDAVGRVRGYSEESPLADPSRFLSHLDDDLSLDLLQFHGDDDPATSDWFPDRVIQAIRLGPELESVRLGRYDQAWGFLVDCAPSGVYGGTGKSWSYERIAHLETSKPVLLAGGLRPENVGTAIVQSGAELVDVCSGVEAAPGIKDPDLLERFFKEVRNAQTRD